MAAFLDCATTMRRSGSAVRPLLKGVGDVRERLLRMRLQMVGEVTGGAV